MELFDVVDKNRDPLGYTKERENILEDNEYNQGAEIWIINDNKILMTQRSPEKSHPEKWEVPGGCSLAGVTSIQTIKREIKEVINLGVNEKDIEFIDTQLYKK